MATKKATPRAEWLGGLVSIPNAVFDGDTPYRPEGLFWVDAQGGILGHLVDKPGAVLGQAAESLRMAMQEPMTGRPHTPSRVRVASPELASVLRAGHPTLDVVCAPTPELDPVLRAMADSLNQGPPVDPTFLSTGVAPDAVAAFFQATAALYRAKPWKVVPGNGSPLAVSIPALGIHEAAMVVMGQLGQSLGLVLVPGLEDFDLLMAGADRLQRGETPKLPKQLMLAFDAGKELPPSLRKEVREHGWEVAAQSAYPSIANVDVDLVMLPPGAADYRAVEAVARALAAFVREKAAVIAAFEQGETMERTLRVPTHGGEVEVSLRAPHERIVAPVEPGPGPLRELFQLAREGDLEDDSRGPLEDELMRRFKAAPEGGVHSDLQACRFVMDYAAMYLGQSVATLDAKGLREVVFTLIPRKVSIPASEADWIIDVVRAFYQFLKREFGLAQAEDCLRVLGDDAVPTLEAALSDRRNFGMAKSMFMSGLDAGFDMSTQAGIDEWMRVQNSQPGAWGPSWGGAAPQKCKTRPNRDAKKKRQAARKARRKNR